MGCCGSKKIESEPQTPSKDTTQVNSATNTPDTVPVPSTVEIPATVPPQAEQPTPVSNVEKEPDQIKAHSGDEDSDSGDTFSLDDKRAEFEQRMREKRETVAEMKRRLTASIYI